MSVNRMKAGLTVGPCQTVLKSNIQNVIPKSPIVGSNARGRSPSPRT
jgi:hypothetical protein